MIKNVEFINGEVLILADAKEVKKYFQCKVLDSKIFKNKIIVLLDYFKSPYGNRNVFCLNEDSSENWQIQDPVDTYSRPISDNAAFSGISISDDGVLFGHSWNSLRYEVDIETGCLSKAVQIK